MNYNEFLKSKIKLHQPSGFEIKDKTKWRSKLAPLLKPHQLDVVQWSCHKGNALIGLSFGMGKTRINCQILKEIKKRSPDGPVLVIAPLGVKQEFTLKDGKLMGCDFKYIRTLDEQKAATSDFHITNYERVRDGNLDLSIYQCVALDEGSCLRNLGSDTTQQFIYKFKHTKYKFVFTATPCPNEYLEIINYADFLGVMDRGQALTRFFKRDSQKAGNLTIHEAHESDFWLWVSSWALFATQPSDINPEYSNEGYSLPPLHVHWIEVKVDMKKYGDVKNRDGQFQLLADSAASLPAAMRIKRASIGDRLKKALEIISNNKEDNYLIWHHLDDEYKAIQKQLPEATIIHGKLDLDLRETYIIDFTEGRIKYLATKPEISGSGCNFQYFCHRAIFLGIDYKFNDFIQALHRIYRFLQGEDVTIDILHTPEEMPIVNALKNKWEQHNKLLENMRGIIAEFGLSQQAVIERLTRKFGCERFENSGQDYSAINNDSVEEIKSIKTNSIGLIHTSIPFGNHYEYSASYNDFGHNMNNEMFWEQMDFLIPELFRVLDPGRNAVIHVKDRIRYNTVTGLGSYTIDPFSDECTSAFHKHGFLFIGRITIVTDVVRENNSTYRLSWSEKVKDASKMGCGLPEYLLLFRKPQTDLSKAFADNMVKRDKATFGLGKWQVLASSHWRSSGNRLLDPLEVAELGPDKAYKYLKMWHSSEVYNYDYICEVGKAMMDKGKLPKTFGLLNPETTSEHVWTDINYMKGLNAAQESMKAEKHICPLPFDIVDRVIDNWSMEGDTILDPFAGLFTVPLCAIKAGRKAIGIELNPDYYKCGLSYLKVAEYNKALPTLFDAFEIK